MLNAILQPYIPLIVALVTIVINVLLLFIKSPWYGYLIANVILIIIWQAINWQPFDLFGQIFRTFFDLLGQIIKEIFGSLTSCSPL